MNPYSSLKKTKQPLFMLKSLKQDKLSNSKGKNNLIHPKLVDKIRNVLSERFVFPNNILNKLQADPTVRERKDPLLLNYQFIC